MSEFKLDYSETPKWGMKRAKDILMENEEEIFCKNCWEETPHYIDGDYCRCEFCLWEFSTTEARYFHPDTEQT